MYYYGGKVTTNEGTFFTSHEEVRIYNKTALDIGGDADYVGEAVCENDKPMIDGANKAVDLAGLEPGDIFYIYWNNQDIGSANSGACVFIVDSERNVQRFTYGGLFDG